MRDLSNPLDDADLTRIKDALERINQAEMLAKKAQRAGIDTSAELGEMMEQRKTLNAIRAQFFPNQ